MSSNPISCDPSFPPEAVRRFLSEFRTIECDGCGTIFAVQCRFTGDNRILCVGPRLKCMPSHPVVSIASDAPESELQEVSTRSPITMDRNETQEIAKFEEALSKLSLDETKSGNLAEPVSTNLKKPVDPTTLSETEKHVSTNDQPRLHSASKPTSANSSATSSSFYLWVNMKYSLNLRTGQIVVPRHPVAWNKYQITSHLDEEPLCRLQELIFIYVSDRARSIKMKRPPSVGEVVICTMQEEEYGRGRVLKVGSFKCDLLLIDFGQTVTNTFDKLYEISEKLFNLPVYSLTLTLTGVPTTLEPIGFKSPDLSGRWLKLDLGSTVVSRPSEKQIYGVLWDSKSKTVNEELVEQIEHCSKFTNPTIGSNVNPIQPPSDQESDW